MNTLKQDIELADKHIDNVLHMTFLEGMECDTHGYEQFRRIYERHGGFLFPRLSMNCNSDERKLRRMEYSNYSVKAEDIFKSKMVSYYDINKNEPYKSDMYKHAYNQGHCNGFSGIHSAYQDAIQWLIDFHKGSITEEQFNKNLDL